ncbi:iron ABC transporter permease [Bacteriovoracales bacterium]|nr:iron ABC transporter permease [Bacteriovoracales bacterium]
MVKLRNKRTLLFALFGIIFLCLSLCVLLRGPIKISLHQLFSHFFNNLSEPLITDVIREIRVPKTLTAIFAGASLATSGLLMQTFFQNPLAGPFILGIQSGSSLGVALWVLGLKFLPFELTSIFHKFGITFSAMSGGLLILIILFLFSLKIKGKLILLIFGLLFSYISSGLINILSLLSEANELKNFFLWSQGSFQRVSFNELPMFCTISLFGLLSSLTLIRPLNLMLLGDNYARSSGLSPEKMKFLLIILTAILAGLVTSFCGPVAFLGVLVPHMARKIFGTGDHKVLIPSVMLIGASLALFSELISSLSDQVTLPLNAILGLIGIPVLFVFLWRGRKSEAFQ